MKESFTRAAVRLGLLACLPMLVWGQFTVGGKQVDIHALFQQGFLYSSGNNFLTTNSRDGSFSMTDGGVNLSMKLTPKLRIGAQAFSRNIGQIGNGKVVLDWALAEYKVNEYLGFRVGRVKTTLGLYNDTQDLEVIHPFALLPQSIYPTDLRANTISHTGGDIFGGFGLNKAGKVNFTLWTGQQPSDRQGGFFIGTRDAGTPLTRTDSWATGGDLRWNTPIEGLLVGYSLFASKGSGDAVLRRFGGRTIPGPGIPFRYDLDYNRFHAFYGDYQRNGLHLSAELWTNPGRTRYSGIPTPARETATQSWYVMGSYRAMKRLELGSYYTMYKTDSSLPFSVSNGIRGPVASARVDLTRYWNVKLEAHFMEGYGGNYSFRGFYPSSNPAGFAERTRILIIRTGVAF